MEMENFRHNQRLAVVVASYDRSSDLWDPLFTLFRRFWPDCPFPVYLVSNRLEFNHLGVRTITIGEDRSWSDTVLAGLARIQEEYVLLWIDDHFLTSEVNNSYVCCSIERFIQAAGNYLRMQPLPKPDEPFNEHFGRIRSGAIYRTATVASVWRRSTFQNILKSGESAWDFETVGSNRSDRFEGFYSTWEQNFKFENLMIKGKMRRGPLRRIERCYGRHLDLQRPLFTRGEEVAFLSRVIGNRLLIKLPSRFAKAARRALLQRSRR